MTVETRFLPFAKKWMMLPAEWRDSFLSPSGLVDSASQLMRWTKRVSDIVLRQDASVAVLREASTLFDEIVGSPMPPDIYGERCEIAGTVGFTAWRHAYLLDRESEAQQWLRVSDSLAAEKTAERERLEAFLYLPAKSSSDQLCKSFLGTPLDVYLGLAILRADRLRKPVFALNAAQRIHRWIAAGRLVASAAEIAFFAAESAALAAAIYRTLGREEFRSWISVARRYHRGMKCQGPMRTKLHILNLLRHRDMHRFRQTIPGLRALERDSVRWGNYRDALTCRFAVAITAKVRGDRNEALQTLKELAEETANTEYQSLNALAVCHIGELLSIAGDDENATRSQASALKLGLESGDQLTLGSVFLVVGGASADRGEYVAAIAFFEAALRHYSSIGAGYWLGYALVVLAEAQIALGKHKRAVESICAAIPIIRRERMVVEGVHAMRLLEAIAARLGTDSIRQLLNDVQSVLK